MTKVVTQITMVVENEVSDEDVTSVLEKHDADNLSEVAEEMESSVEAVLAAQFRGADNIPILDVTTEVEE